MGNEDAEKQMVKESIKFTNDKDIEKIAVMSMLLLAKSDDVQQKATGSALAFLLAKIKVMESEISNLRNEIVQLKLGKEKA